MLSLRARSLSLSLSLLRSRAPLFSRGQLIHVPGGLSFASSSLVFVAAAQGIPLDCLGLVANGACFHGSPKQLQRKKQS